MNDEPRNCRLVEVTIEDNVAVVRVMVEEDARVTHVQLEGTIGVSSRFNRTFEKLVLIKVRYLTDSKRSTKKQPCYLSCVPC